MSLATDRRHESPTDDIHALLEALPPEIVERLSTLPPDRDIIEIVMDLGRRPEARFGGGGEQVLLDREVVGEDIQYVIDHIGSFGEDNRAGIERTLHRISAIRNRSGKIVGLTCRIGRAVFGTIEIIGDLVESGKSVLIMGRPGVGKTTMLREAARVLADDLDKRVVVVDTSNEIAGDGDIPHPAIGRARRMQVATPNLQHAVMIEAVENHMPEVIVIDEIGTELEASASRTIAERGVQLIGTAHGNSLENLMLNPTLSDLIGGIQSVTLGDEEARRRRTQKSVLERKAPPTFDVVVEIQDRDRVTVHADVAETIDAMLRGDTLAPELRWKDEGGVKRSQERPRPGPATQMPGERFGGLVGSGQPGWRPEPGWRPDAGRFEGGYRDGDRGGARPGYRSGATGGWRTPRGRSGGGRSGGSRSGRGDGPGEFGGAPAGGTPGGAAIPPLDYRGSREGFGAFPGRPQDEPFGAFRTGEIADRGPLERPSTTLPDTRARDARELDRQRQWREAATRALQEARAEQGLVPLPESDEDEDDVPVGLSAPLSVFPSPAPAGPAAPAADEADADEDASTDDDDDLESMLAEAFGPEEDDDEGEDEDEDEDEDPDETAAAFGAAARSAASLMGTQLPMLRVLGFGISRKRLEQAIRELQLPVVVVREIEEADVVMTLRNYYRQKAPALREAEERAMPMYVLKSNTVDQMQACLIALYSLELDPREAAMRETEDAIGEVIRQSKPVELSPQNAYIRRIQHQMAERANIVSRSRGREPYRRVRLYPDQVRAWQ